MLPHYGQERIHKKQMVYDCEPWTGMPSSEVLSVTVMFECKMCFLTISSLVATLTFDSPFPHEI